MPCSLLLGLWRSVHIDDLRRSKDMVSDVTALRNFTISQLFREDTDEPERKLFQRAWRACTLVQLKHVESNHTLQLSLHCLSSRCIPTLSPAVEMRLFLAPSSEMSLLHEGQSV